MRWERYMSGDVIVVGSGPGGASVARQLAKAGKRVLILERGFEHRHRFYYGTYLGALLYSEKMSLLFTREGLNIVAPLMVGGATSMYTGCGAPPPPWLKEKYGIDIDREVAEITEELGICPLPPKMRGTASTRLAQAAAEALGQEWFAQPKFMNPERRKHPHSDFDCTASCMLGCRCGAKWNAAEWIDEAVAAGAHLFTGARVRQVTRDRGKVTGVRGSLMGVPFHARANTVVLSAGGLGSPRILQQSGFDQAGVGMTMDTTLMVYGFGKEKGTGPEPPMTWSWENMDVGYMLSTLTDPWLLYPMIAIRKGLEPLLRWGRWEQMLGLMIKLKDDVSGGIHPNGKISKPLTRADNRRLQHAYGDCRKILLEAGARADTIFMTPLRGTHPSGTVRIGEMLGKHLETTLPGLYVCDASTFPESLDRPTVLTILGLGTRLAEHLLKTM